MGPLAVTPDLKTVYRWLNIDLYWRLQDAPDPAASVEAQPGDRVVWREHDVQVESVFDEGGVRSVILRRRDGEEFPADVEFTRSKKRKLRWPEVEAAWAAGEWRLPAREAGRFKRYPPNLLRLYPLADQAGQPRQSALRDPLAADLSDLGALERLAAQLRLAAEARDRDAVEARLRAMEAVCLSRPDVSERAALTRLAEARLEFGLACQALGETGRAIDFFIQAARDFKFGADAHGEAIARWMASRLQLETSLSTGLANGRISVDLFHKLAEDGNRHSQSAARWYRARLPLLRAGLADAATARPAAPADAQPAATTSPANHDAPPTTTEPTRPADAAPTPAPAPEPEGEPAAAAPPLAQTLMELAIRRLYSAAVRVSANARGELVGRPAQRLTFRVETNRLLIGDRPHTLHDLSGGRDAGRVPPRKVVPLDMDKDFLLAVTGDSMNAATPYPINDGDYVICREMADPGDQVYVIALLPGEKGQETGRYVVKYRERNQLLSLTRQPSDPDDPADPYRPIKLSRRVKLVGQVLAVLKPIT